MLKSLLLSASFFGYIVAEYIPVTVSFDAITRMLQSEHIAEVETLESFFEREGRAVQFTNEVHLVQFCNGQKAVFKPVEEDDIRYAYAEVAAYNASQWLGFPFVPPTVLRTVNGAWGSLQWYVHGESEISFLDPEQEAAYKIFGFIFGQWDLCSSNQLIYKDEQGLYLVAIDNANIADRQKSIYGQHPYVCLWAKNKDFHDNEPFPFQKTTLFVDPQQSELYDFFVQVLPIWMSRRVSERLSKRKRVSCIKHYDSVWLQSLNNDLPFAETVPDDVFCKVADLDAERIRSFFVDAPEGVFSQAFFDDIIDRQKQVIAFVNKKKEGLA